MENFIVIIEKYIKLIKLFALKFYNKLLFLFSKQMTIQKMYEPLTQNRYKKNAELLKDLRLLKKENSLLKYNIQKLKKENSNLKKKILILQDILIRHN